VNRSIASADKDCGTKFTHAWIEPAKFRAEAEKQRFSPYSVCDAMVNRVRMLCRSGADEKATVAAKIKGFQCGYGNPRSLSLSRGIIRLMGNTSEANFDDWAKPWLQKQL
jgi:hypothetical protein